MIVHGSVSHEKNNVYCTGAKFTIEGKQHNNMLSFETIRLSMVKLAIQVGDQEVQELREMTILSPTCFTEMKCIVGLHTYLITSPLNKCGLRKIRTISMQSTQIIHNNKLTEYLVNHDHKLIIRTTDTARDDNCGVQIHHTNYPELKILIDSEALTIGTVQSQINMDLELQMSEEYLMYKTEELMMSRTAQMQLHLCTIGLNNIAQMERSPLYPDALIRNQGLT